MLAINVQQNTKNTCMDLEYTLAVKKDRQMPKTKDNVPHRITSPTEDQWNPMIGVAIINAADMGMMVNRK